jgi:hypothetical protein
LEVAVPLRLEVFNLHIQIWQLAVAVEIPQLVQA